MLYLFRLSKRAIACCSKLAMYAQASLLILRSKCARSIFNNYIVSRPLFCKNMFILVTLIFTRTIFLCNQNQYRLSIFINFYEFTFYIVSIVNFTYLAIVKLRVAPF